MSVYSDLKTLYFMMLAPISGVTHAERLESFYGKQAKDYDEFRDRLLWGRRELFSAVEIPEGAVWADIGGGTGASLEFMGNKIQHVKKGYIVDLSPSLLRQAQKRILYLGTPQIELIEADAGEFVPEEKELDLVTFSYSLTMIPEWFKVLDHAWRLLKPGGQIGIVDFFVSRKYPPEGFTRHGWFMRTFWPIWFGFDNVNLNSDHVPYLHYKFDRLLYKESLGRLPFSPFARVPYYLFIGCKAE